MPVVFTFPQGQKNRQRFSDTAVTICKEQTTASYQYAGPSTSRTIFNTKMIPIATVYKITNPTTGQPSFTSFTANITTGTDIFEYHLGSTCEGQTFGQSIKFLHPSVQVNYCFHMLYTSTRVNGTTGLITTVTPKNPLDLVQLTIGVRPRLCYL